MVERVGAENATVRQYVCEQLRRHGVELFCTPLLIDQLAEIGQTTGSSVSLELIFSVQKHNQTNFENWPRGSRKPDKFKRLPLKGLWKAHSMPQSLSDIRRNIKNELSQDWLKREWNRIFAEHANDDVQLVGESLARKLANASVIQSLENRGKRNQITSGHWLVFSKLPEGVFFLCRAHHREDDQQIFDRVQIAAQAFPYVEFPFRGV